MLFAVAREHQSRFRQDSPHIQPFLAPIQCCFGPPHHHPPPEFRAAQGLTLGISSPLVGETLLHKKQLCRSATCNTIPNCTAPLDIAFASASSGLGEVFSCAARA